MKMNKQYCTPAIEVIQLTAHERLCGGDLLTGSGIENNLGGGTQAPKKRQGKLF
jgi:hypothetical protein